MTGNMSEDLFGMDGLRENLERIWGFRQQQVCAGRSRKEDDPAIRRFGPDPDA